MPSIVNGLFSGRSGIASHGLAIAVIGDNISNASTIGYKAGRSEFEDLISGGQTAGKTVGSGSSISAITNIFDQGTLEFTGRDLDLAIDGNGFFIVSKAGQRSYTRAGNFKIDASGYIVDQKDNRVLGFPATGSGALEELSINGASQGNIKTENVTIAGNLDASGKPLLVNSGGIPAVDPAGTNPPVSTTTYGDLAEAAAFSTVITIFDSLGAPHTVTTYFYHTQENSSRTYYARSYVNSGEVDPLGAGTDPGLPRQIGAGVELRFRGNGSLDPASAVDFEGNIPWNNGSDASSVKLSFSNFTMYSTGSNIQSLTQDGNGVGAITSLNIDRNGDIYAMLDNGQSSILGTVGMANFSNSEGLVRVGSNLLQESRASGAPIVGRPGSGTFGAVEAGSLELSTVDIASEFVKLITLQRGFQANSRIITTINQLLNEIIQLA
ncbi:MAG: flagellar hook protein FlgE [Deltaproteobacteria bacterium]|nr:flagellar hook protein FlgE [Deltaproteobacteria bacterium]